MAVNSTIKRKIASGYDTIYPQTHADQVVGLSTAISNAQVDYLDELLDVNAPSPSNNQALLWNSSTSKWVPGAVSLTDTNTFRTIIAGGNTLGSTETLTLSAGTNVSIAESGGTVVINSTDTNTDTNNYLTGVSGSGDGTVTFTRDGLTNLTWDASHSHSEYAPLASPALTGVPTAPTTATSDDSTKIATTAYVKNVVSDLIGGAPAALDTLNELAAALADDASFSATITTALAGKLGVNDTAVNSDKVDGYHIVVGSTGSDTNTLYFTT